MSDITFDSAKNGYSTSQVDSYIRLIQNNYDMMASRLHDAEQKALESDRRWKDSETERETTQSVVDILEKQLEENEAENEKLHGMVTDLSSKMIDYESLSTSAKQQKVEADTLKAKMSQLEEQLNSFGRENEHLKQNQVELERIRSEKAETDTTIRDLLLNYDQAKRRMTELQQEIDDCNEQKKQAEDQIKTLTEELSSKEEVGVDKLSDIFLNAKQQADEYVDSVHKEMEQKRIEIEDERKAVLEKAEKEAADIREAARRVKEEELDKEKNNIKYKLNECDYTKQEADAYLDSAQKEADNIIRKARIKMELAEEKDRIIVARAMSKAKHIEEDMTSECEVMQRRLNESTKRLAELYAFIGDLEELKDPKEIMKFGDFSQEGSLEGLSKQEAQS